MIKKHKRYIYDALYGAIDLDFDPVIWRAIASPELQRLREVRLCNINSLCLTGGANVNRFEHSLGTCYLAQECLKAWPLFNPLSKSEERLFLLAALLHDTANAAFGHSLEYIESSVGFNPERDFAYALQGNKNEGYQYRLATFEQIYFDMGRELVNNVIIAEEFEEIGKMVCGKGRLGPLISGIIDLDNIDNVFRMAYHVGIVKSGEVALELARNMWVDDSGLVVRLEAKPLLEEWQRVRYELYKLLLLNPEEFSGKCMLSDAISLAKIKEQSLSSEEQNLSLKEQKLSWYDIDYELLKKVYSRKNLRMRVKEFAFDFGVNTDGRSIDLTSIDSLIAIFSENKISLSKDVEITNQISGTSVVDHQKEYLLEIEEDRCKVYRIVPRDFDIASIVMRLMSGKLYGCLGIFSTTKVEKYPMFTSYTGKLDIENEINKELRKEIKDSRFKSIMVSIHPILDVNKTERKLSLRFDDGEVRELGNSSRELLLGVFASNVNLNMYDIQNLSDGIQIEVRKIVANYLADKVDDPQLKEVELYAEVKEIRKK